MAEQSTKPDKEDDNQVVIISMRADRPAPLPTAVIRLCNQCGEKVWAAPTSLQYQESHPEMEVTFRCIACASDILAQSKPKDLIEGLLPGSLDEVMSALDARKDPHEKGN